MKTLISTFLSLLLVNTVVANDDDRIWLSCDSMQISYSTSSSYEALEYWSQDDRTWIVADVTSGKEGKIRLSESGKRLPQASLYRLNACAEGGCESSSVAWIPIFACASERDAQARYLSELSKPVAIEEADGTTHAHTVAENLPQRNKIITYNTMLWAALAADLQKPIPEMLKPDAVDPHTATVAERIEFNVWLQHELARTGSRPDVTGTGWEEVMRRAEAGPTPEEIANARELSPGDWN